MEFRRHQKRDWLPDEAISLIRKPLQCRLIVSSAIAKERYK